MLSHIFAHQPKTTKNTGEVQQSLSYYSLAQEMLHTTLGVFIQGCHNELFRAFGFVLSDLGIVQGCRSLILN
jgi:hypothetical protein